MTDGLTLPRPVHGEAALAVVLTWIAGSDRSDDLFAPALQPLDASGAPDTLAEHLAAAGLPDWRDFIAAAAGPGQPASAGPAAGVVDGQRRRPGCCFR